MTLGHGDDMRTVYNEYLCGRLFVYHHETSDDVIQCQSRENEVFLLFCVIQLHAVDVQCHFNDKYCVICLFLQVCAIYIQSTSCI